MVRWPGQVVKWPGGLARSSGGLVSGVRWPGCQSALPTGKVEVKARSKIIHLRNIFLGLFWSDKLPNRWSTGICLIFGKQDKGNVSVGSWCVLSSQFTHPPNNTPPTYQQSLPLWPHLNLKPQTSTLLHYISLRSEF